MNGTSEVLCPNYNSNENVYYVGRDSIFEDFAQVDSIGFMFDKYRAIPSL